MGDSCFGPEAHPRQTQKGRWLCDLPTAFENRFKKKSARRFYDQYTVPNGWLCPLTGCPGPPSNPEIPIHLFGRALLIRILPTPFPSRRYRRHSQGVNRLTHRGVSRPAAEMPLENRTLPAISGTVPARGVPGKTETAVTANVPVSTTYQRDTSTPFASYSTAGSDLLLFQK